MEEGMLRMMPYNHRVACFLIQRLCWWLGCSLSRTYTPHSPGLLFSCRMHELYPAQRHE